MRTPQATSPSPTQDISRALEMRENRPENGYVSVEAQSSSEAPSSSQSLSISAIEGWEKELMQDPKNRFALNALTTHQANDVLTRRSATIANSQVFNIKIDLEGDPITNQKSSGRCWLFAATNVFRIAIMRKYNIKKFELSQSYLFYWDKLEKANYFLENILDTLKEDLDGRLIQTLLAAPVNDGGQWDMVANLVQKYGLVPQALYPDSFNATASATMNTIITTKLRENALTLRHLASTDFSSLSSAKEKMMQEIHLILTLMLGPPPSPVKGFTWEFYDKEDKFRSITTTAVNFAAELSAASEEKESNSDIRSTTIGYSIRDLFSLVNDPRNKYSEHLTVSRLGNIWGARPITYVNVDMAVMKKACIEMLKAGLPVFFGSDVGKYSSSKSGIMDTDLIDYELGFNIKLSMDKAQRLMTAESAMTHAMVLTAVHVVDEQIVRWRVQNSWGDKAGKDGWFVASDRWMDEFTYQAVVDPHFVAQEIKDVLKKDPIILPLWDPMGALA